MADPDGVGGERQGAPSARTIAASAATPAALSAGAPLQDDGEVGTTNEGSDPVGIVHALPCPGPWHETVRRCGVRNDHIGRTRRLRGPLPLGEAPPVGLNTAEASEPRTIIAGHFASDPRGLFDEEIVHEELTQVRMGRSCRNATGKRSRIGMVRATVCTRFGYLVRTCSAPRMRHSTVLGHSGTDTGSAEWGNRMGGTVRDRNVSIPRERRKCYRMGGIGDIDTRE